MAKIVELILADERVGLWQKDDDPVRMRYALYTKDWTLICNYDWWKKKRWEKSVEYISEEITKL
jgi:hypothetical protein